MYSSVGSQYKYYNEEDNCWYKADLLGGESDSEVLTAKLLQCSTLPQELVVNYEYAQVKQSIKGIQGLVKGCKSHNFLNYDEQEITIYNYLLNNRQDLLYSINSFKGMLYIMKHLTDILQIDMLKYYTYISTLDALILNTDRHLNNISYIKDINGFKYCPIFDNGCGFFVQYSQLRKTISNDNYRLCKSYLGNSTYLELLNKLGIGFNLYSENIDNLFQQKDLNEINLHILETTINVLNREFNILIHKDKTPPIKPMTFGK